MAMRYELSRPKPAAVHEHPDYEAALKEVSRRIHGRYGFLAVLLIIAALIVGAFIVRNADLSFSPLGRQGDPEIRSNATEFFRSYLDGYSATERGASDPDAKYPDLMKSQLADRKDKGTVLGQSIDKHTKPLVKNDGGFKDGSQARKEFRLIHDSLKAGMRDAAK